MEGPIQRDGGHIGSTLMATRKQSGPKESPRDPHLIERVQTGARMEKRLIKVLKALAEYYDISLGDLLEGIVLHAFDGLCAFEPASLDRIKALRDVYGLDLDAKASHQLKEGADAE